MPKRIITNQKRKDVAVEKLTELAEARTSAEAASERARHRMFAGMLKAYEAGMTYEEIAETTGLSKIRVSQVLAEQREKNPEPVAKKAAPKKAPAKKTAARKRAA